MLFVSGGGGVVGPDPYARNALTATSRSVHSGHSLTDAYVHSGAWPKDIRLIAKSVMPSFNEDGDGAGGIVKSTIPGSSLRYRWNNPTTPKDARLDASEFGTLVITEGGPPPRPHYAPHNDQMKESLEYLLRFAQNQYDNGAGQEVIVWSIWPYLDGNASRPEASHWTEFGGFRNALPEYGRSYKYMADYATWKMRQLYPALPADWRVWLFPGHLWMQRVYDDVQAGLVPGVTDFASLFNDDIHPSDVTGYGLACFMFSLMYQVDLRTVSGAYVPPGYPAGLAAYYQRIAWELATSYEPAGMGGTDGAALVFDPAVDPDPLEEAPVDPGELPAGHRVLIEDSVSGATFTPALPAAVGGIRTFDGVTQYVAPYATTGTYAAMAIRTDAPGGVVDVLRFTNNPADQWANGSFVLARNAFISGGALQAIRYNPEETVSGKTASNGNWLVVEMIADGNALTIYCDGEETMTAAAPMGATSQLVLFPQIAGGLLSFVTYDDVPADRAAIRAYMQAKIDAASETPVVTFDPALSQIYFDADTPYAGTPERVTGVSAEGTLGLDLPVIGSHATMLVTHSPDGISMLANGTAGRYIRLDTTSPQYAGAMIVARVKLTVPATGTANLLRVQTTSGTGRHRFYTTLSSTGAINILTGGPNIELPQPRSIAASGEWFTFGMMLEGSTLTTITENGEISTFDLGVSGTVGLANIWLGQVSGTFGEVAIFGRAEGEAWPYTLEEVWEAVSGRNRVTLPADTILPLMSYGQSHTVMGEVTSSEGANINFRAAPYGVMLGGLKRRDGANVNDVSGAGFFGTDGAVQSTGLVPAAVALRTTSNMGPVLSAAEYMPEPVLVATMCAGYGGANVRWLDNDPAEGDDPNNGAGWSNLSMVSGELSRLATASGRTWEHVPFIWSQDAANQQDTYATYEASLRKTLADVSARVSSDFGMAPSWIWSMSGGDRSTTVPLMTPGVVHLDICNEMGAVMYHSTPYTLGADDTHMTGAGALLWSETMFWLWTEKIKGRPVPNTIPTINRTGSTITVTVPKRGDMEVRRDGSKYAGGIDQWGGFEVEGGGAITGLEVANDNAQAVFTVETSGNVTHLRYMAQTQNVTSIPDRYGARRGEFYLHTGLQSVTVPTEELRVWLLPFRRAA